MNLRHKHVHSPSRRPSAFTILEILAVIVIMVIVALIAIPAFNSMIYSSKRTLAESMLASGIRSGRDAALGAGLGEDGAAVFVVEPDGVTRIIPCVRVGQVLDRNPTNASTGDVLRDVFIPHAEFGAVTLPDSWTAFGYAPAFSIDTGGVWYDGTPARYDTSTEGRWVHPETAYFDETRPLDDGQRQSFMIRFDAATGAMTTAAIEPAIVLLPRATRMGRTAQPYSDYDPNSAASLRAFVNTVMSASNLSADQRRQVMGDRSADTVLARAVSQVALCDIRRLASGISAANATVRLDRTTHTIYRSDIPENGPRLVAGADTALLKRWIEGDTNLNGRHEPPGEVGGTRLPDVPDSFIFTIDRYTGAIQSVVLQSEPMP